MACAETEKWLARLSVFRAELADLAYSMDLRGRAEAADVALMASARIGEICEELHSSSGAPFPQQVPGKDRRGGNGLIQPETLSRTFGQERSG